MGLRMATADEITKAVARRTWLACAKTYGVAIDESKIDELFEKWWKNNGAALMRRVGHMFHEGVEDKTCPG